MSVTQPYKKLEVSTFTLDAMARAQRTRIDFCKSQLGLSTEEMPQHTAYWHSELTVAVDALAAIQDASMAAPVRFEPVEVSR